MVLDKRLDLSELFGQVDLNDNIEKLAALLCIDNLDRINQLRVGYRHTMFVFDH